MSKRALFVNGFSQLRRLWKAVKRHDRRLELAGKYAEDLEKRISDLETEIETLFASEREHHPATRPVVKPEPTGEPKPCHLVDAVTGEPSSRLFAEYGDAHEVFGYNPATIGQVRAEAVRLGLLDTERQKLEHEFMAAWLTSPTGTVASYEDGKHALEEIAEFCEGNASGCAGESRLRTMAAVLAAASEAAKCQN